MFRQCKKIAAQLVCKHVWKFKAVLPAPTGVVLAVAECVKCKKVKERRWS